MNAAIEILQASPQLLAQVATDHASVLFTYGPLGVISAWLMFRAEKLFGEVRTLAHRIDGLTKALLVDMIDRDTCGLATKRYAREEVAKIDARLPKV